MLQNKIFGTDGVRGRANHYPMSPDVVLRLGQAIGWHFKQQCDCPRILVGKDTRRSGYMLEQSLCAGMLSVGADAYLLGPLPTPGVAYLTQGMRATAGIVISASHNLYDDNGIKIFNCDGFKLSDQVEQELDELVRRQNYQLATGAKIGKASRIDDAIGQYAVFLKEQFPKNLTLDGLRIVIDCANGAGYRVAPKVFRELGAEVIVADDQPNGRNINLNCGTVHPANISAKVTSHNADFGLAIDGDADRLLMVDANGEYIDGDVIMGVCARHLLANNRLAKNTVVATVMSNSGLEQALRSAGGQLVRTQVGDRYVVEEMCRGGFNLGGEKSGHIIHRDCSTTGDGVLAALKFVEVAITRQRSVAELRKEIELLPQVHKDLAVPHKKIPLTELAKFTHLLRVTEKKLADRGRVLVRYSGTENKARVMIEGEDQQEIKTMANELIKALGANIEQLGHQQ